MTPSSTRCRLLPAAEWDRLRAIEPFATRGLPDDPGCWAVLVVEQRDLSDHWHIVGSCSLFTAMHWDCWWIDASLPGTTRGIILRMLLRGGLAAFKDAAIAQVYTGAEDGSPEVAALLERFGFTPAPGRLFVLLVADAATALQTPEIA